MITPMEDDSESESIDNKLYDLVKRLEEKGVSGDMLKQSARKMELSDCSYGSQSWVNPVMGLAWGIVGGLLASYTCDGLCNYFHASTAYRIGADIAALTLPIMTCFSAGGSIRAEQDYKFYKCLQEIYRDELLRK